MTILEIFKSRLPEGLEIIKVKERYCKTDVTLRCRRITHLSSIHKMCVPGDEEYLCDIEICNVMMAIAMKEKDNGMFKLWMQKQQELIFSHHSNSPDGVY